VPDRFVLACDLSRSLFTFTVKHAMCESIQSLFSCVTLPLECGLALMAKLNASASDTAAVRVETTMLQAQAWLLLVLIQQATRGGAGVQRFVAHLAAPDPLLEWLSAAVNRVLAMHGTSLGRGRVSFCRAACCQTVAATSCIQLPYYLFRLLLTSRLLLRLIPQCRPVSRSAVTPCCHCQYGLRVYDLHAPCHSN
jgi:hypothetical protein